MAQISCTQGFSTESEACKGSCGSVKQIRKEELKLFFWRTLLTRVNGAVANETERRSEANSIQTALSDVACVYLPKC